MRGRCFFVLVVGLLAVSSSSLAYEATMEDLQALVKQEQWDELLAHAKDIAPSKRDAAWSSAVEAGAVGMLGAFDVDDASPLAVLDAAERLVRAYPSLRTS